LKITKVLILYLKTNFQLQRKSQSIRLLFLVVWTISFWK